MVFNNISVISWQSVLLVEETGVPGEKIKSNLVVQKPNSLKKAGDDAWKNH